MNTDRQVKLFWCITLVAIFGMLLFLQGCSLIPKTKDGGSLVSANNAGCLSGFETREVRDNRLKGYIENEGC